MAQKDKIKELVGRGLGSYHTKALQQMNRIEKKNKEQNHKINILTNELDNDYLTKTEEGSVVSLEHSKEGMVYLDELQGNTLVNYCTDGSKELTLNGDIDVEGTFVTTTEGVDNGLIDVACEGNTLVNLISTNTPTYAPNNFEVIERSSKKIHLKCTTEFTDLNTYQMFYIGSGLIKSNTTYTLGFYKYDNISINFIALKHNEITWVSSTKKIEEGNYVKYVITTNNNVTSNTGLLVLERAKQSLSVGDIVHVDHMVLLEGDYTNKPIPPYFESMKSVGELEDNKIEILSRKSRENLLIGGGFEVFATKDSYADMTNPIKINPNLDLQSLINKTLLLSVYKHTEGEGQKNPTMNEIMGNRFGIHGIIKWGKSGDINSETTTYPLVLVDNDWGYINTIQYKVEKITPPVGYDIIKDFNIAFQPNSKPSENNNATWILKNAKLEIVESITDTPSEWCPHLSEDTAYQYHNKKEISLNEPLRGIGNVKDRKVKIGGKWYVERNCGELLIDGSDIAYTNVESYPSDNAHCILTSKLNNLKLGGIVCDKLPVYGIGDSIWMKGEIGDKNGVSAVSETWGFAVRLLNSLTSVEKTDTYSTVVSKFKAYLQNNPIKVIYQLATPIYEPLEIDPTLNTYNDITHISNNSTISCNMKIQNSGYNSIIKPSTQYTVAFDTNKSGEVGINLGGSKVTTTNNVATVTTPATLTDDSLRLYGKGIKVSKVRLLEGDKTNWIPSFFEGMKSSFEDKLQDDGTYKMEILSNNKNLFSRNEVYESTYTDWVPSIKIGNKIVLEDTFIATNKTRGVCGVIKLKPSTNYTVSIDNLKENVIFGYSLYSSLEDVNTFNKKVQHKGDIRTKSFKFTTPNKPVFALIGLFGQYNILQTSDVVIDNFRDIQIEEGSNISNYIPHQSNKIQFSSIEPLRGVGDVKDRFVFKDNKLMIERNCHEFIFNGSEYWIDSYQNFEKYYVMRLNPATQFVSAWSNTENMKSSYLPSVGAYMYSESDIEKYHRGISSDNNNTIMIGVPKYIFSNAKDGKQYLANNPINVVVQRKEPTYEEIPFELQKIILEGYENGTLFLDTNIPPTVTTTYAGETPIVKSVRLNKAEVLNNTNDINDNIVPYLMDMDYRVVCLQLEGGIENISMARLFGGTYEMLQRDIQSKRYSVDEYKYRLDIYLSANKITEDEYEKLGGMLYE